jgi:hypothetical protein
MRAVLGELVQGRRAAKIAKKTRARSPSDFIVEREENKLKGKGYQDTNTRHKPHRLLN